MILKSNELCRLKSVKRFISLMQKLFIMKTSFVIFFKKMDKIFKRKINKYTEIYVCLMKVQVTLRAIIILQQFELEMVNIVLKEFHD